MSGEDQVRGGLALSGVGVDIAAHQTAGLPRHQGAAVGGLAHRLIGGGEVQKDGGTLPGQDGRGRLRGPQVLADLHADDQIVYTGAGKDAAAVEAYLLAAEGQVVVHAVGPAGGGEPALLVKLPVIGQVRLGYQAQNLSFLYNSSTIIQFVIPFIPYRQAQSRHHVQIFRGFQDGAQALLGAPQQRLLQKQVAAGVAGEAQLRQGQDFDPLLVRLPHEGKDLLGIIAAVRHMDLGGTGGHFHKSVFHGYKPPCKRVFRYGIFYTAGCGFTRRRRG